MLNLTIRRAALLATCLCASAFGMPTLAAARIWVSVNGSDTDPNCGPVTEPCRSFQHAHDMSPDGGEIDVATPGGYGELVITKGITINGGPGALALLQATGAPDTIVINAPGKAIYLNGLGIDGAQSTGSGIVFNAGSALTITNCTIRHFAASTTATVAGNGVVIVPATGPLSLTITNSVLSDNGSDGVLVFPSGAANITGNFDKLTTSNNSVGIYINTARTTSGKDNFVISNSIIDNSVKKGLHVTSGTDVLTVQIINNQISSNKFGGVFIDSGDVVSYGGNVINNNSGAGDVTGTLNTAATR